MSSQTSQSALLQKNADTLVSFCAGVKNNELVLLIFDDTTREIEPYLRTATLKVTSRMMVVYMDTSSMHGVEPPANIRGAMEQADVILALTKYSLAHTNARFNATERGARYLSLPQYGIEQLSQPSLSVDYISAAKKGKTLKTILDTANRVIITTTSGTSLEISLIGRIANWAPGYCHEPGTLGSPPDIETNIAPVEEESNGIIVADGSIPCEAIGLLKEPVRIVLRNGRIIDIEGTTEGVVLKKILEAHKDNKRKVLAEFGIGLNPKARLCGLMLEDEGALGTVHFGFGSNATIGGINKTDFHLDMVMRYATIDIDGKRIMEQGSLLVL